MESYLLLVVLLIASIVIYRALSRKFATSQGTVRSLLRHYRYLEAAGLTEQECLFRILSTRRGWKRLPHPLLNEIVSRLGSKESVMRFVVLSEGHRLDRTQIPKAAKKETIEAAMLDIACVLASFGNRLQSEGRLKEAEFVQKLALRLQPNQYFTNLTLAVTYYKMERYSDAVPLFKEGLARLETCAKDANLTAQISLAADCLNNTDIRELSISYKDMYDACLKAARVS